MYQGVEDLLRNRDSPGHIGNVGMYAILHPLEPLTTSAATCWQALLILQSWLCIIKQDTVCKQQNAHMNRNCTRVTELPWLQLLLLKEYSCRSCLDCKYNSIYYITLFVGVKVSVLQRELYAPIKQSLTGVKVPDRQDIVQMKNNHIYTVVTIQQIAGNNHRKEQFDRFKFTECHWSQRRS